MHPFEQNDMKFNIWDCIIVLFALFINCMNAMPQVNCLVLKLYNKTLLGVSVSWFVLFQMQFY